MDGVEVRALDPEDPGTLRALLRLDALSFRADLRYPEEEFRRRLALPTCRVRAAVAEGRVLGLSLCQDAPDALFLDVLAVEPAWRGRGVGVLLVRDAVALARAAGRPGVRVHAERADQDGRDLVAFYRREGFEVAEDHGGWVTLWRAS